MVHIGDNVKQSELISKEQPSPSHRLFSVYSLPPFPRAEMQDLSNIYVDLRTAGYSQHLVGWSFESLQMTFRHVLLSSPPYPLWFSFVH